jgi:hypothetical protein
MPFRSAGIGGKVPKWHRFSAAVGSNAGANVSFATETGVLAVENVTAATEDGSSATDEVPYSAEDDASATVNAADTTEDDVFAVADIIYAIANVSHDFALALFSANSLQIGLNNSSRSKTNAALASCNLQMVNRPSIPHCLSNGRHRLPVPFRDTDKQTPRRSHTTCNHPIARRI